MSDNHVILESIPFIAVGIFLLIKDSRGKIYLYGLVNLGLRAFLADLMYISDHRGNITNCASLAYQNLKYVGVQPRRGEGH